MNTVTIITPTYNRSDLLEKLYLSLEKQTNKDFLWLIVDDGSTDDTKNMIDCLKKKSSFLIEYIFKRNGGKHTALNYGINVVNTELTMIVDSDDVLLPNAIKEICDIHEKYKNINSIGAYSFLKCFSNGKPIVSLHKEEFVTSYVKYRIKENRSGDMAEVFKTNILKKYPFPVFDNEKFLSEDVVWIQLGLNYKYVFVNKAIYQCEYLDGGLTANDKPMKFASPMGSMMRGKILMNKECGIKQNIKGAIIYECYKKELSNRENDKRLELNLKEKTLCFFTKPMSNYFYKIWKKETI